MVNLSNFLMEANHNLSVCLKPPCLIPLLRTCTYACWCKFCKHTDSDNGMLCGSRDIVAHRKKAFSEGRWLLPGVEVATLMRTPELFVYKKLLRVLLESQKSYFRSILFKCMMSSSWKLSCKCNGNHIEIWSCIAPMRYKTDNILLWLSHLCFIFF